MALPGVYKEYNIFRRCWVNQFHLSTKKIIYNRKNNKKGENIYDRKL